MHPKTSTLCWERGKGRTPQERERMVGWGERVVKMLRKRVSGWGRKWVFEQEEEGEGMFTGTRWSGGGLCAVQNNLGVSALMLP